MSAVGVLIGAIIAIVCALLLLLAALASSTIAQSRNRRREPDLAAARRAVVAHLSTDDGSQAEASERLRALPRRDAVGIVIDMAVSVGGSSRTVLHTIADEAGLLVEAGQGLSSRSWARRLYSARLLTALGAEGSPIPTLLLDRTPEVRAQAASWAAVNPSAEIIELLGTMLDDDDGLCRFAAQDALVRIGLPAAPMIATVLMTGSEQVADRAMAVAAHIGDHSFAAPLVELAQNQSAATRALAAEALGGIGNSETQAVLVALLDDEAAAVRRSSIRSLASLGYWPAAAEIEALLDDPAWEVRREAARALPLLGAVGEVLLRSTASGVGQSSTLAAQALELEAIGLETVAS